MAENRELALVLRLVADEFKSELRNSQGALSQFNNFVKDWRTQLAAVGTALFAIAKSTANFGEEALKGAQKAGTTVESFTALSHAAKMADVEQHTLINSMKTLSVNMAEAARGNKEAESLFARLGVSVVDATGKIRSIEAALLDIADVFKNSSDGALKNEASVKLFAKAWEDMLPFMNQGSAVIREQIEQAKILGVTMSEQDAKAAAAFNEEMKKLTASMNGLALSAGNSVIPVMTDLTKVITELMGAFKAFTANSAAQFLFKGLAEQAVLFSTMIKEAAANVEFLFGKFTFDQLKTEIKRLEAEASAKLLLLENPAAAEFVNGPKKEPIPKTGGGRDVFLGANVPAIDQEKLGKALLEIFLAQNRAIEIRNKLMREAADGANEYFLAFDRQQQREKEDQAEQVRQGQTIVEQTQLEVQIREAAQQRERDGLIQNAQAWIDYGHQVGASTQDLMDKQVELVRANLANQLQITTEEAGQLLEAWKEHESMKAEEILNKTALTAQERETIELQSLKKLAAIHQQYAGNIFDGWRIGLQQYVQATQSAFGFAADMARRTAQFMEQNFRQFFFDVMDNKIKSMKDLFASFGNFVKQIVAQVLAQLATMMALKAITGGFGGGFGSFFGIGGTNVSGIDVGAMKFAEGGTVLGSGNRDTVHAMLMPGEGVLNHRGMATLDKLNAGVMPAVAEPKVTINFYGLSNDERPKINYKRQFDGMVIDCFFRHRRDLLGLG